LVVLVATWATAVRSLRAGIVVGGAIGLGFAVAENAAYFLLAGVQGGASGLVRAIVVRGLLEGAVHPLFTASAGAGLGPARARSRPVPAVLGFAAAVGQHALWNGVASPAVSGILCDGMGPGGACRGDPDAYGLLALPLIVGTALAPGVVALATLARRAESP